MARNMSKRAAVALETLKAGGFFRKYLASASRFQGAKFRMTLRDSQGRPCHGYGFQTFYELEALGLLSRRIVPVSSTWPEEWELKKENA